MRKRRRTRTTNVFKANKPMSRPICILKGAELLESQMREKSRTLMNNLFFAIMAAPKTEALLRNSRVPLGYNPEISLNQRS